MNYKQGDPVRVKLDGSMWYFYETVGYSGVRLTRSYPVLTGDKTLTCKLDEIEPLLLRHPYYGKMVSVWDDSSDDRFQRIFLDNHGDMVMVVATGWVDNFRKGQNYYEVEWYEHWEPIPEEPPADPTKMTPEERKAFEVVQGYLDRLNRELKK